MTRLKKNYILYILMGKRAPTCYYMIEDVWVMLINQMSVESIVYLSGDI